MNLGDEHDYNMPNALFLADVLERSAQTHTQANAAAEMRRLHAELERCKQVCAATSEAWREEAALAEPVQEPVANDDEVICPACCHQFRAIPPNVQQMMLDAGFEPPFTTPPQRKPLTEEEISNIWDGHIVPIFGKNGINPVVFARAIERAHNIKE